MKPVRTENQGIKSIALSLMGVLTAGWMTATTAHAMQWTVKPDHVYASGVVDDSDPIQLRAALAVNPRVKSLVIVNGSGADMASALRLAAIIGQQKMDTTVVGYCIGACAPLFVAGEQRRFAAGEHPRRTLVGIQGGFDGAGKLDRSLTDQWASLLKTRLGARHDDGVMRTALEQALDSGGMLRVRDVARNTAVDRSAFFCESAQSQISDCRTFGGKDALTLGLVTAPEVMDLSLPEEVRPKPDYFGRVVSAVPADGFMDKLRAQGVAMCAGAANCLQRWDAALPVFQRQKPNRAVALGVGTPGLGFSDDQESFDLAAKRATYLCNHAANNKKLCKVVAVNETDLSAHYVESADALTRARTQLKTLQGVPATAAPAAPSPSVSEVPMRFNALFADTPAAVPGVRVWSAPDLAAGVRDGNVVVIDLLGPAEWMIPGAIHFWEGGLAFADQATDAAYERRFADMLKVAAPAMESPVVFYCRDAGCWHAVNAAQRARRLGYTQVGWLRTGLQGWAQANLPLARKVPSAVIH